ncbi:putative leader peptide [Embleya sp. NPDC056575]
MTVAVIRPYDRGVKRQADDLTKRRAVDLCRTQTCLCCAD